MFDTNYENCLHQRVKDEKIDIIDFFDLEESEKEQIVDGRKEWEKHWQGMPEFEQEDNPPYKKLIISFRNETDYREFAKLIDQKLTEKTKSIWYPELDREENSLLRWIETGV